MRLFLIPAVAALLVLAAGRPAFAATTPVATADDKGKKKGDDDKKGKKDEGGRGEKLPKAVARAVESIFPGMKVVKVEEEDEDGDVVYEVTLRGKGGTLEAKLTPKGRVVEIELKGGEDDEGGKGKKGGKGDGEKGKKKGDNNDERKGEGEKGKKKGDRD